MTNQEINKRAAWWNISPSTLQQFADQVAADEREACAKADDAMIDALMNFSEKASFLHHPDVPYHGTDKGDSADDWKRRLVKAALEHAIRARGNK